MGDLLNGEAFFHVNLLIFYLGLNSLSLLQTQLKTVSNWPTECALYLKCQWKLWFVFTFVIATTASKLNSKLTPRLKHFWYAWIFRDMVQCLDEKQDVAVLKRMRLNPCIRLDTVRWWSIFLYEFDTLYIDKAYICRSSRTPFCRNNTNCIIKPLNF